ncbi:MAG TPA: hypothetical protein DCR55_05250 [Lentisphaeria bacterium]|nr:hypothetical protein [Lentisphaeria bacterium]
MALSYVYRFEQPPNKETAIMRTSLTFLALIAFLLACGASAKDEGKRKDKGKRGMHGPRGGGSPMVAALDADKDGSVSAVEIANASAALLTLDRDGDGALSREELRPKPPSPEEMVERMMAKDADGDGVLKGDEIPGMMQDHLDKIDANGDGAIDAEELGAMAEKRRGFKRERGKN